MKDVFEEDSNIVPVLDFKDCFYDFKKLERLENRIRFSKNDAFKVNGRVFVVQYADFARVSFIDDNLRKHYCSILIGDFCEEFPQEIAKIKDGSVIKASEKFLLKTSPPERS